MIMQIELGDIILDVTKKDIKNIHLSVYPPTGSVRLSAPTNMNLETIRLFAISKIAWIRKEQKKLREQLRESQREYIDRESHYVWGQRYLLAVEYREEKPSVTINKNRILLTLRPGNDTSKAEQVLHEWHISLLREIVPEIIQKWEAKLKVKVNSYFLQRMKTKWGSCNHNSGNIRLNTELVKKPKNLLEYVIVHEMAHLVEPTHNDRFIKILDNQYHSWREARAELNILALSN